MSQETEIVEVQCPVEDCEATIKIEMAWEPPETNYGADADGNRGMYVSGYWCIGGDLPDHCLVCKTIFDKDQLQQIEKDADEKAIDSPEPEYDDTDEEC